MPSKTPKRPKVKKKPSIVNTPYHYVSADYKDFEGFVKDLLLVLRRLGVHATYDPSLEGSDGVGIVLSPVPIDPVLLSQELNQVTGGDPDDISYEEAFIPPPALFKKSDTVIYRDPAGVLHAKVYRVVDLRYNGYVAGWEYDLTTHHTRDWPVSTASEVALVLVTP